MTTRPTDEEIRAMADMVGNCMFDSAHDEHQWKMQIKCASLLSAWLAERQAARNGVTTNEREAFEKWWNSSNDKLDEAVEIGKWKKVAFLAWQARAASDQQQFPQVCCDYPNCPNISCHCTGRK